MQHIKKPVKNVLNKYKAKEVKKFLYINPEILEDSALSKNTVKFMLNSYL